MGSVYVRQFLSPLQSQAPAPAEQAFGGCIEAEVWAEAKAAMRSGESKLHHFSLTADEACEEGMVCGGTMDIFVEVLYAEGVG